MLDGDEWHCFQCGTYFYPQNPIEDLSKDSTLVPQILDREPGWGIEDLVLIR